MRLPTQDSSTGRGLKTSLQGFLAAIAVFGTGFFGAIHSVPGCSEAVENFLKNNVIMLASSFGVSTGLVTFIWNLLRPSIKNY